MNKRKCFLTMIILSSLTVATQTYSDTTVNIDNQTSYCGQVMIQYGPENHPKWNVNNLPFVSKAAYEIGHINDINNFPNYVLGLVQLQSIGCNGAHFSSMISCYIKNAKNVYPLSDRFTVHVSTDAKGILKCNID